MPDLRKRRRETGNSQCLEVITVPDMESQPSQYSRHHARTDPPATQCPLVCGPILRCLCSNEDGGGQRQDISDHQGPGHRAQIHEPEHVLIFTECRKHRESYRRDKPHKTYSSPSVTAIHCAVELGKKQPSHVQVDDYAQNRQKVTKIHSHLISSRYSPKQRLKA